MEQSSPTAPRDPHVAGALLQIDSLSPRYRKVYHLIGDGLGYKEIACRLNIGYDTAKFYAHKVYEFTGKDRPAIIRECAYRAARESVMAEIFGTPAGIFMNRGGVLWQQRDGEWTPYAIENPESDSGKYSTSELKLDTSKAC